MNSKKLSSGEVAAFCEQMAYMVGAGISMQEGLMIVEGDLKNETGARIMQELLDAVEEGQTLGMALKKSERFPDYMVHMVDIGEASGRLEQVLQSLCAYYERQESIARSIKSAVTFPLIMIGMMIAVILVVIIEVLPVFQNVFQQLGGELSGFVQGLMQFGSAVSNYAVVIIVVIAAIIAVILILRATKGGKQILSSIYERMFRKTATAIASGRFASAMALMLSSGMDVDAALEMTQELNENPGTRKKIARMQELMAGGMGFSDAIVETEMFSGLYGKMITVGFKTGTLDSVMQRIAERYEEEADRRMGAIVSALEPTLVAILSLIVGLILISVMLPLMGVMSAIG